MNRSQRFPLSLSAKLFTYLFNRLSGHDKEEKQKKNIYHLNEFPQQQKSNWNIHEERASERVLEGELREPQTSPRKDEEIMALIMIRISLINYK